METQSKNLSEFQLTRKKKYEETVALLRLQLYAKEQDNASIQADIWVLMNDLSSEIQHKDENIIVDKSTTPDSQDHLDERKTHRQQLLDFQREGTRLKELNNEASSKAADELVNVKEALATAEAELEALYATLAHNKQLQIQCDAALVQNTGLIQTKYRLLDKMKYAERSLAIYRTKSEEAMNRYRPCLLPHAYHKPLLNNPEFCQRLLDFGTSITALSTPSLPRIKPRPQHQPSPPFHAHVTLTVQPSTPSWNLFQRAQSALSRSTSSAFAVKGPPGLAKRFFDEMQSLKMHHAEETRLAKQWKRVAEEHLKEARGLTEELEMERKAKGKGKEGSGTAEHRRLLDELKAR